MTNKKTRKVAEKKVVTTKVVATTDAEATEETLATEEAVVTYTGEFLIVRSTPKRQLNKEGGWVYVFNEDGLCRIPTEVAVALSKQDDYEIVSEVK